MTAAGLLPVKDFPTVPAFLQARGEVAMTAPPMTLRLTHKDRH